MTIGSQGCLYFFMSQALFDQQGIFAHADEQGGVGMPQCMDVSVTTGKKYNSPKGNWKNHLHPVTNKYCEMLGVEIVPAEYAKNLMNMSKEKWEYEQSFKDYILNDAKLCLSYAGSLEHFIFLMKRMGYEFKGKDYLSVKIPGMKLYHQLDKMDDIFSKEELSVILKYGYGQYYRKYQTKGILYVKQANLTPLR